MSDVSGYSRYTTCGYLPYNPLSTNDQQLFNWGVTENSNNLCVFLINGQLTTLSYFSAPISNNFLMLQSTSYVKQTVHILSSGSNLLSFYYRYYNDNSNNNITIIFDFSPCYQSVANTQTL